MIHATHKMEDWKSTIVTHSSGNSRFGKERKCSECGAIQIQSVGGKETEDELLEACPFFKAEAP